MDRSRVAWPSRSRCSPGLSESRPMIFGCTNSSTVVCSTASLRSRPSGSVRTALGGPIGMTARRSVGTTNSSSWLTPAGSDGSWNVARPRPTGTSTARARSLARDLLVPTSRPAAGAPTLTRAGSSSIVMSRLGRPMTKPTAMSSASAQQAAMRKSSCQPSRTPSSQQATATSSAARPAGVVTCQAGRTLAAAARTSLAPPVRRRGDGAEPGNRSEGWFWLGIVTRRGWLADGPGT